MNLLIKILLSVIIISELTFAQDCKSNVRIHTNSESSVFFLDSTIAGEGISLTINLTQGDYILKVVEDLKKWNTEIFLDTLNIADCNDINLIYSFKRKLLLDTNPQDVYVTEGDSLLGFTPLLLENDFQEINLHKPGYLDVSITNKEFNEGLNPELIFTGEEKGESFYNTTLFKILVGTAIALGATTAYYKLEADSKFDDYQLTGDPELLKQTDRYDVISGVSFVAMQINIGLIIYLFLSD